MSLSYADTTRDARMDSLTSALGTTAFLEIFTGTPPGKTAGVFNADTGTKLASLACSNPVALASSAGLLTFGAITAGTGLASGTPGYFRLKTAASGGSSTVIVEGTAGVGSGDISFNTAITLGQPVSISSATITEGDP